LLPKLILWVFFQKRKETWPWWLPGYKRSPLIHDILNQGWSWQGAIGNIREWRNCQSCDLLPGVVLPARLGLPIQTWQSDMVKAFQEIEQYCYEWELLLLSIGNYFNPLNHNAPYLFFYLSNARRFTRQWGSSAA
jgi:hypothetical protein